jgi:hypothetical protein
MVRVGSSARLARSPIVFAGLVALLLAGCMSDEEAAIERRELPRLVLQPRDLPAGWTQFDGGRQLRADAPPGERSDPTRFGRIEGWKARYRRPGASPETRGPLVVESRADLFEDAGGAESDFEAAKRALASGGRPFDAPDLGSGSYAVTSGDETAGTVRFFTVVWRHENVLATLSVNGFHGRVQPADVVELARKQQARIDRAADRLSAAAPPG